MLGVLMPRPRSEKTQAALDDIEAGMSQSEAARKHGVDQGLLSRMLKPKEKTVNVKLTINEIRGLNAGYWTSELVSKFDDALLKLKDKKHEKERRIEK